MAFPCVGAVSHLGTGPTTAEIPAWRIAQKLRREEPVPTNCTIIVRTYFMYVHTRELVTFLYLRREARMRIFFGELKEKHYLCGKKNINSNKSYD